MSRTSILLVCVACVCACALVGAATAQDTAGNETVGDETESPEQVEKELYDLIVRTVEYSDGEFSLVVEWTGQTPEELTLTERVEVDGGGSTKINMQSLRLYPGEKTEISIGAERLSGGEAAVMLVTEQSLDNGDALVIQNGDAETREPVPFNLAAISVIGSALIGVGVSIALVVRRKNAEERGKERIA